jgi:hypothetical protein
MFLTGSDQLNAMQIPLNRIIQSVLIIKIKEMVNIMKK